MSALKKIAVFAGLLVIAALAFLTWYKYQYSMDVAKPFEVGAAAAPHRVLIATQGSDFKNAIVDGVVAALRQRPVFIKVIDVSGLGMIDTDEWHAVVVLHTWENWQPQADVAAFVDRQPIPNKLISLTTSGDGDLKMGGVDAIASASRITDVPRHVTEILRRIDALMPAQESRG